MADVSIEEISDQIDRSEEIASVKKMIIQRLQDMANHQNEQIEELKQTMEENK
ncbi:MAG: hypothetical protein GF364_14630, partial [Candidatus Lokiarchaeota archaeon]|nr:hypothetical protein [Candidatus Lokiarchaeota archaeon]